MTTHVRMMVWALQALWGLKSIWFADRLKLGWKSIRLYLSFLAFTDKERPSHQLRQAMTAAFLSAVYDFDSDWFGGNVSGKHFHTLLRKYVSDPEALAIAENLFAADTGKKLSACGLERGGVALYFYHLLIQSKWLSKFSEKEIRSFGVSLQMIDDLLDLEQDRVERQTNCFLTNEAPRYADQATAFLSGIFFNKLVHNSSVYRVIAKKAKKSLRQFSNQATIGHQLWAAGRPHSGVYAFFLAYIGFRFYPPIPIWIVTITATCFALLTTAIMVFNDWKDRENDRRKGKIFASTHPKALLRYWLLLSLATFVGLSIVAVQNATLTLFCLGVWTIGNLYSFLHRVPIVPQVIVAVCCAAPALCGTAYYHNLSYPAGTTAFLFFCLILLRELYKDCEDRKTDRGYKATLPILLGNAPAMGLGIGLLMLIGAGLIIQPNMWAATGGVIFLLVLTFKHAPLLLRPDTVRRPMATVQLILIYLLFVLLVTKPPT